MSNGVVAFELGLAKHSNEELAALHLFERAGMGKAPFRVKGYSKTPGTTCDYCGTPCVYVALIESADGQKWKVGCDCVHKVGDAGLLQHIKNSAAYRQIQREKRVDLDQRKSAELEEILSKLEASDNAGLRLTAEGYRNRLRWCGMAGRARVLKELRRQSDNQNGVA